MYKYTKFEILIPCIFLLISSIEYVDVKTSAQSDPGTRSAATITINPGAVDSSSQNPVTPQDVTIPIGSTVTWLNKDSSPHLIASGTPEKGPSNDFYGDYFYTDKTYSVTLNNPGIYEYYDPGSSNIRGQITVVAASIPNNTNSQINIQTQQSSGSNNNIVSQQPGDGTIGNNFLISGPLSSFISTPSGNWVVNGNWILKVQNGNLSSFTGDMLWDPTNISKLAHTHNFANFKALPDTQSISLGSDRVIDIKGLMDIGANNNIEWVNIPAEIKTAGNTITVLILDDSKTGNHFNNYPIFGKISHVEKCSDRGSFGSNMDFDPSVGKCSF